MGQQKLVNIIRVPAAGNLAPGAIVTLPHGLKVAGQGVLPNQYLPWAATNIIVNFATTTDVTFQNTGDAAQFAFFRVEYDHSIHAVGTGPLYYRGITGTTPPSGPASGDLGGNYPNPKVIGIDQQPIDQTDVPAINDAIVWNGTKWIYQAVGAGAITAVYGQFYSNIDQPIADGATGINTFTFEGGSGVGVSVVDPGTGPSQITVAAAGVYSFCLSPQFFKTAGAGHATVNFWARKGGIDVPESASFVAVTNNEHSLPFVEIILPMNAGEYVEWVAHSDKINVTIEQESASVAPAIVRPAAPAIIATVKRLGA